MLVDSLKDSIIGCGLKEPLEIWELPGKKGVNQVIKGHRRLMAIMEILAEMPNVFNEKFPKGIPVVKWTDITEAEVVHKKLDHSDQLGLRDPHELQRSANMLFELGATEAEVAMELSGLIDIIRPMDDKNRQKLAALKEQEKKAEAEGNTAGVTLARRDIRDLIFNYRRGFVQNLHNIQRCPDVVMASLYKKACGETPKGYEGQYLPPVTTSEAVNLYKLHSKDCETLENGMPVFNKTQTGPEFNKRWNELCAKHKADEGKVPEARPKAMAAKEMAEAKKSYKSELAVKLTTLHCGEGSAMGIAELDEEAYRVGLVKKHNPEAYKAMMDVAAVLVEKLRAEALAALPKG
jgi:hypothetical protein